MSKPILVANWKNNPKSTGAAKALLTALSRKRAVYRRVSCYIAPPLSYLDMVAQKTDGFAYTAVQDFSPVSHGTHTGLVTADILKGFGVRIAIIGHSEARALGETDSQVALKVKKALESGIVPLVCIGEKITDAEGDHLEFLRHQLKASLEGVKKTDLPKVMVAYEPVWAIGKRAKDAMSPEDLTQMVIFIRKALADIFGREAAEKVAVLYGGSVESGNAQSLFEQTGIRGFLVGHASLDAKEFADITEALS